MGGGALDPRRGDEEREHPPRPAAAVAQGEVVVTPDGGGEPVTIKVRPALRARARQKPASGARLLRAVPSPFPCSPARPSARLARTPARLPPRPHRAAFEDGAPP